MKKSTTTNQFTNGLMMDFTPLITPNNVLTDALNATIITNNGNELVLLNDMGNGRVETAFLPEGYIPVGSCSFGDIIYIASYNPFVNKCLLGCFPSPQRNISSSQLTDLQQSINENDFQIIDNGNLTGELNQSSLKKIVYENNLLSGDKYIICADGIANESYLSDLGNISHEIGEFPKLYKIKIVSIEDDGKITELSSGLKWYKPHEYFLQNGNIDHGQESKIDIDEWRSAVTSAYSIFSSKTSGKLALLIELESINGFSCTWGVNNTSSNYDSNILTQNYPIYFSINWETENNNINPSGIILTEGKWYKEDNENFVPSILTYKYNGEQVIEDSKYIVNKELPEVWDKNDKGWTSEISRIYEPEKVLVKTNDSLDEEDYDSEGHLKYTAFKNKYDYKKQSEEKLLDLGIVTKITHAELPGTYYLNMSPNLVELSDDIVNNTFKYSIRKEFDTFSLPIKQKININDIETEFDLDLSECIYKYKIAPFMPYGVLEQFTQEGTIDFSKIGKKSIKLNTFKYYNQSGYSTFTWGLEGYCEPNHKISEVVFEFYDNQGIAAALHVNNKDSYNGVFTNYLAFEGAGSYGLNDKNLNGELIYHKGLEIDKSILSIGDTYVYGNNLGGEYKINDPSVFPDTIYLNDAGNLYYNWLYLVKINIKYVKLDNLGNEQLVDTITDYRWFWTTTLFNEYYYQLSDFDRLNFKLDFDAGLTFNSNENWINGGDSQKTYGPNISDIKEQIEIKENEPPISLSANAQIQDSKGKPNLVVKGICGLQNTYDVFYIYKDKINQINGTLYLPDEDEIINNPELPEVVFTNNQSAIYNGIYPNNFGNNDSDNEVEKLKNNFDLKFYELSNNDTISYLNENYDFKENVSCKSKSFTIDDLYSEKGIELVFKGEYYSKYYFTNKKGDHSIPIIKSCISNSNSAEDLQYYNLAKDESLKGHYCPNVMTLCITDIAGKGTELIVSSMDFATGERNFPTTDTSGDRPGHCLFYRQSKDYNNAYIYDFFTSFDTKTTDNPVKYLKDHFNFNFLFPYVFMRLDRGGNHETYVRYNSDAGSTNILNYNSIQSNTHNPKTDPKCWHGTIACSVADDSYMSFSNPNSTGDVYSTSTINNNSFESTYMYLAPIKYGRMIYSFLSRCLYLTDSVITNSILKLDNIVYLNSNYTDYSKDIVLKLEVNNNTINLNLLICFHGIIFLNYINLILDNFNIRSDELITKEKIKQKSIVNLQIGSCLKTFPLRLRFNYKAPDLDKFLDMKYYYIDGDNENIINGLISSDDDSYKLEKNKIYFFETTDPNNLKIGKLGALDSNKTFRDDYGRTISVSEKFATRLSLKEGRIQLSQKMFESSKSWYSYMRNKNGRKIHFKEIDPMLKNG